MGATDQRPVSPRTQWLPTHWTQQSYSHEILASQNTMAGNNLCFDDTNPAGEQEQYFVAIEEMVKWLGFEPKRITYSSDNFDHLYALAEALIEKGRAYVCHCSSQ